MNSNGPRMDVWLIYKCDRCDSTWKLTLHSGILPRELPEELFRAYESNCRKTAERLAFDRGLLRRNGVDPIYDGIELEVVGEDAPDGPFKAEIRCAYPMDIRATRVLSAKMGLSRGEIERRIKQGRLWAEDGDLRTMKLRELIVVHYPASS